MRNLLLLIGPPAAGKSTWVIENGLQEYTLGTDNIRTLFGSIKYGTNGAHTISQNYDEQAWHTLFEFLEHRMKDGEFTIIDAPNTKINIYEIYKALADKYRYKIHGKIFDISYEKLIEQNANRPAYKYVPEDRVTEHYKNLQKLTIPDYVNIISDLEETEEIIKFPVVENRNVYFIGSIHGTIDGLLNFITYEYNEKDLFIFLGDYIDRGVYNDTVLNLLYSLGDNAVFLEGYHEQFLHYWANDAERLIQSDEFINRTMLQLEKNVNKDKTKEFCLNLKLYFAMTFNGKRVFACHGGVPKAQVNFISAKQIINGVGEYFVLEYLYKTASQEDFILVHGYRNQENYPTEVIPNAIYNLEGRVEYGENLRVVKMKEGENPEVMLY